MNKIKRHGMCLITISLLSALGSSNISKVNAAPIEKTQIAEVIRPIKITGENPYKSFYLDEEVYHYANQDLIDLRILDEHQEEVPYYIYNMKNIEQKKTQQYPAKVMNEWIKDKVRVIDIEVEQEENVDRPLTYLELGITNTNFATNIRMQGSFDGIHWEQVNQGEEEKIYNVASDKEMRFYFCTPVKYSYFRLTMPDQNQEISFGDIWAGYEESAYEIVDFTQTKESKYEVKQDEAEAVTHLIIENTNHLNIKELKLKIEGSFNRDYVLYGIDEDEAEICLGSGRIYTEDLSKDMEEVSIYVDESRPYSKLKVDILNLDDKPLQIDEINEIISLDKVVFKAEEGKKYQLSYGNEMRIAPSYDIAYYIEAIEKEPQDEVVLGEVEVKLSKEKAQKDYKILYKILIGMTSLILIVVIIQSSKKKAEEN